MLDVISYMLHNLHHAYLIEGDFETRKEEVFDFLKSLGVEPKGNPNVFCRNFEYFSIDDSRLIKELQMETPAEGKHRFFVLGAGSFPTEAQNALLKVFEEPAPGVHFFLITPSSHILLDTLRSRLSLFKTPTQPPPYPVGAGAPLVLRLGRDEEGVNAKEFLALNKSARLKFIEKMIKKAGENKNELKEEANNLLNGLETFFFRAGPEKLKNLDFEIKEILKCRKYLSDRGASVKMLLEHLAVILPAG